MRSRPATLAAFAALALLALGLRALALHGFEQLGFARWPQVDAWTYYDQARQLFQGEDPFAEGFYQPPGYPWLLAAVFRLVGEPSLHAARLLNLGAGLLSTLLVGLLGQRLGRRAGLAGAGWIAALLYTLFPRVLLFELDVLTPALTNLGLLLALNLAWWDERPHPLRSLGAGLLLGLTALLHPTYLLAAAAVLGGLLAAGRAREAPQARRLLPALLFLLGVGAGLWPTASRNLLRWHHLSLVSENAGINLYLGNNPDWRRTAFLKPGIPFRQLVLQADPAHRDQFERNRYWLRRTADELREHPLALLDALATKALWSVNAREIPRNEELLCRLRGGPLGWLRALPVRYWWVLPLAVWGAAVLWRRGGWRGRGVSWTWLALHLVLVIFLVASRYRLATWPLVALAGGAGAEDLGRRLLARLGLLDPPPGEAPGRLALAAVGLSLILPHWPLPPQARFQPAWCAHLRGNLELADGHLEQALSTYREALELDPDDLSARRWVGEILYRQGHYAEAARELEQVVQAAPDHYPTRMLLVRTYEKLGDWAAAAEHAGAAFAIPGERHNTGLRYVRDLLRAGQVQVALDVLREHPELARDRRMQELLEKLGLPRP